MPKRERDGREQAEPAQLDQVLSAEAREVTATPAGGLLADLALVLARLS